MLSRPDNNIVLSQGENTVFVKRVLALSAVYDLALLEVERDPIDPLILKDEVSISEMEEEAVNFLSLREDPPRPDEDLFITAYPKGVFTRVRKTGNISYEDSLYYAFSVNRSGLSGASGSPVLDEQGQVVGVSFGGINNFLYIIKVNYLRAFIAGDTGIKCPDFNFNKVIGFAVVEACMKEEMENLKELAEEGSVYAQFRLSRMFLSLSNLDIDQAFQWVERSAGQGYAPSQFNLSVMYFNGEGIERDPNQAFQWMERSAEQGHVPAQYKLAVKYSNGEGIVRDINQSFRWMERSAEQGYAPAQYRLAVMYSNGEGIDRDLNQSFRWMERSAEQGYAPAQHILAVARFGVDVGDSKYVSQVFFQIFQQLGKMIKQDYYSDSWPVPWTSSFKKNLIFFSKENQP